MQNVSQLPHRPVRFSDIQRLNDSDKIHAVPYGGVEEDGEMQIFALKLATDSTAHALGFDDTTRRWTRLSSAPVANIVDTEQILDDALDEWALSRYGDRFEVTKLG